MKPRLLDPVDKTGSAESVYAEKYQWLMRWALHFCDGDREMAEDLVQDTFMRMLSSWATIRDVEHPERFLYTYLKYGFLRLRNADRKQSFQSLDADFDLLDRNVLSSGPGLIEWQEEIRSVVDFLCWRKSTAKSASLLLFRFFHGMFPAEIMLIARMSRKAVDDSLASSKLEARAYVGQNSSRKFDDLKRKPVKAALFVAWPPQPPPSTEDMIYRLLEVIYAARDGDCLSYAALNERYSEESKTPVDCWLLSHIVSCTRCLDIVEELLKLPPRGSRPLEDVLGYAPKGEARSGRSKDKPVSATMRSATAAKDRYRAALDTIPASIALIVNGESVASREVSGSLNKLTVDLKANHTIELIEVESEQGILLTVPVLTALPERAHVQRFEAKLGDDRSVTLKIEFDPIGVRLHVVYLDPLYLEPMLLKVRSSKLPWAEDREQAISEKPDWVELGARLRDFVLNPFVSWLKFALLFVGIGTIAALFLAHRSQPQPAMVIAQAVARVEKRPATGIEEQQVRITSQGTSFERTLHTDLAHKLRPKQPPMTLGQAKLRDAFESAHVAWNDPLSPASFRDWREEQRNASDSSIQKSGHLLTVTTKVSSGTVREESLTLNADNLHTVGRTIRFSDSQEIQIAELEYRIIPLTESDPAWFESPSAPSDAGDVGPRPHLHVPREVTVQPTQSELDVAELNVLLAFAELHADGQERLTIKRGSGEILVVGLVGTNDRKLEIEKRLHLIPHTGSSIKTFPTFEGSEAPQQGPSSVSMSESTATASPLETFSAERHLTAEEVRALHRSLLEAAIELRRSAMELQKLHNQFPADSLTDQASSLQMMLIRLYAARLEMAAVKEKQALQTLGVTTIPSAGNRDQPVSVVALTNAQLCFELISQEEDTPRRPAQNILHDLAVAVAALNQAGGELAPPS